MSFDQKLKSLRIEHKMTQDQVANHLHVARSTIAGYETKHRQPSHENLISLAQLFHVSIDFLIGDNDQLERMAKVSDDEYALLLLYRRLSKYSKTELLKHGPLLQLKDENEHKNSHHT